MGNDTGFVVTNFFDVCEPHLETTKSAARRMAGVSINNPELEMNGLIMARTGCVVQGVA